ncbi:MAG: glycosyltransferase family 4 protein [Micromonosporaceae bacterium]
MHITLVHRDLHQVTRGGICTIYRALAPRLVASGHQVTLLTQHTPHPVAVPGADVVALPRTDDLDEHRHAVAAVLRGITPDVVDCSTWEAETLTYLQVPRELRAAVVARGDLSAATMGVRDLADAERQLVHTADAVIAVSVFAARDLATVYGIPAPAVISNGVDRDTFHPGAAAPPRSGYQITLDTAGHVATRQMLTAGAPVPPWNHAGDTRPKLVWVGKITPMKGWDRLVRIRRLLGARAHLTLLLGHAPAFCPVELTGRGDVTVIQDLDDTDLRGFYRAADWLLSTSRWEGFGLAIAEAIASGTPALLPADLGTAPELLAAGGGLTYTSDEHVLDLIAQRPATPVRLPACLDWDRNTQASLALYQQVAG